MPYVAVHLTETMPEWRDIAGLHPRKKTVTRSSGGLVETIQGVLEDDGPIGTPSKLFRVSYLANANLADLARFLAMKVDAGEDLTNLVFKSLL
jgi:hypothetical protein